MSEIQKLLAYIGEDKNDNPRTTSLKFKEDLYNFFNKPEFKEAEAVEFGTHKGQTTYIMSHLFKHVYTINWQFDGKEHYTNRDRDNITFIQYDLRTDLPLPVGEKCKVYFIDAIHEYFFVRKDIDKAIQYGAEDVLMVFDDYGLIPDVHRAVNDYIKGGILEIVTYLGHEPGHEFVGNRVLTDYEGVITKLKMPTI